MINRAEATEAPGFTATDTEGRKVSLADFKGKRHVVLVFNRGLG